MEGAPDQDGVFRAAEVVGRMVLRYLLDADAGPVSKGRTTLRSPAGGLFQEGDETAAAAGGKRLPVRLGEDRFQPFKSLIELIQGNVEQGGRDERFDDDVFLLELDAGFPGEDEELP
jgi:hypothetical protein